MDDHFKTKKLRQRSFAINFIQSGPKGSEIIEEFLAKKKNRKKYLRR